MLQKSKIALGKLTIADEVVMAKQSEGVNLHSMTERVNSHWDVSGHDPEVHRSYPKNVSNPRLLQTMAKKRRAVSAASIKVWKLAQSSEALQCIPASLKEKHLQDARRAALALLVATEPGDNNNNFENNDNNFENNNFANNNGGFNNNNDNFGNNNNNFENNDNDFENNNGGFNNNNNNFGNNNNNNFENNDNDFENNND